MTNGRGCSIISKLSVRRHEAGKRMEKSRSWPSAHDWKSCIPQKGIEGSNPSFSAKKNPILADGVFFLAEIRRRDLNNQMQVSGGHLLNAAARTKAEIMPHARPGMGQFLLWRYFAERSTALRSMEWGGTGWGSCMKKPICGVRGSSRGAPSRSVMAPAGKGKGLQFGPTHSSASP